MGVEALVRWQHPERGLLNPDLFLPVAEETGLIASINEWVLRQACADVSAYHRLGYKPLRLSVNISLGQLQQENSMTIILNALAESGLDPHLLGLEIT